MKTVTLQIGNSDDKLTQAQWSLFITKVQGVLDQQNVAIHFFGVSPGDARWQNACWVFEALSSKYELLRVGVSKVRKEFSQTSAAWTAGDTEMI